MSDQNNSRYRPRDYDDRELEPTGSRNDPLAELARLIGQNDPFAHLRPGTRPNATHDQHDAEHRYSDHDEQRAAGPRYEAEPRYSDRYDDQTELPPAHDESTATHSIAPHDHHYAVEPNDNAVTADAPYDHDPPMPASDPHNVAVYQHDDTVAGPEVVMAEAPELSVAPVPDEFYQDAPRRRGLRAVTVTVVMIGCAAIGIASAFAYRAYLNLPSKASPPPVIRASAEPTKVAPPAAPKADTAKLSYDRVGDRSQNEKVVVQEEKPIDPKNFVTAAPAVPPPAVAPPAAASPAAVAPVAPPPAQAVFPPPALPLAAAAPPQASTAPPSVLTEPKRIRTVAVRPDQPDAATRPPLGAAVPAPTVTATAPPAPGLPVQTTTNTPAPPSTRAVAQQPAWPAPTRTTPARAAKAPLALTPGAPTATTSTRSVSAKTPPTRLASTPPTPAAPKAAPAARASGYMVQVASQKTEADAQTSFRRVRAKYSSVLGTGEAVIRRADLGAKGVYYRAMVGPYATREQAVQVCANLKAAGGSCVIQRR